MDLRNTGEHKTGEYKDDFWTQVLIKQLDIKYRN